MEGKKITYYAHMNAGVNNTGYHVTTKLSRGEEDLHIGVLPRWVNGSIVGLNNAGGVDLVCFTFNSSPLSEIEQDTLLSESPENYLENTLNDLALGSHEDYVSMRCEMRPYDMVGNKYQLEPGRELFLFMRVHESEAPEAVCLVVCNKYDERVAEEYLKHVLCERNGELHIVSSFS